jgi:hypothetical protein
LSTQSSPASRGINFLLPVGHSRRCRPRPPGGKLLRGLRSPRPTASHPRGGALVAEGAFCWEHSSFLLRWQPSTHGPRPRPSATSSRVAPRKPAPLQPVTSRPARLPRTGRNDRRASAPRKYRGTPPHRPAQNRQARNRPRRAHIRPESSSGLPFPTRPSTKSSSSGAGTACSKLWLLSLSSSCRCDGSTTVGATALSPGSIPGECRRRLAPAPGCASATRSFEVPGRRACASLAS